MLDDLKRLKKALTLLLTPIVLLSASNPLFAHHAFSAEYDSGKPIEVTGTVTRFEVTNPHSWIFLDVKDPDGAVTNWGFEFGAPFSLKEKGITKRTFPYGTQITIKGYRAKSGKNFGYAVTGTLADGRTFRTGGAQDAPGTRAPTD